MPEEGKHAIDEPLEPLILLVRGHRVILDADLGRIYGVSTRALNQAVKRNAQRFPRDFAFQLNAADLAELRSQPEPDDGNISAIQGHSANRSQFVTGSQKHRSLRPWVFGEHGALMAANVVRSDRAVQMSIFVTRAFVRMREHMAANAAILKRLAEIDSTLLRHDAALREVYLKLQPLLLPPPELPKRRIGF